MKSEGLSSKFRQLPKWLFLIVVAAAAVALPFTIQHHARLAKIPALDAAQVDISKILIANGVELSSAEIRQVVALASQCGISNVHRLKTLISLPDGKKLGFLAEGRERTEGRTIFQDQVTIRQISPERPAPYANVKRVGSFWVDDPSISTLVFREFVMDDKTFRVNLEGVDIPFADKVVPVIVGRKAHLDDKWPWLDMSKMDLAKPCTLSWNELIYYQDMISISFTLVNEEVHISLVSRFWF